MKKAKVGDLIKLDKDNSLVFVVAEGEGFQSNGVYYREFVRHNEYIIYEEGAEKPKGIFVNIDMPKGITASDIVDSLTHNVAKHNIWREEIKALSKRDVDGGMLLEYINLGPKFLDEIVSINTLSDKDLKKYCKLYRKKQLLDARQRVQAIF